jgi:TPP-dependent pyruvate/acetoin dehydrogenase alpha subunit
MVMIENSLLYHHMYRIRRFEETVLDNFHKGVFSGTTHTYLGQEANAVGVLNHIHSEDVVFSNHRCHGHFLAYGGDMYSLYAELMGKSTGVCGGRGGSQHLHWNNFYSNGIQGGITPIATGMAMAEKFSRSGGIVITFLGDGTLGQGIIYESLNIAALWGAPILYVLENNRIAQTTPIEVSVAGDINNRFTAFGIKTTEIDSSDVLEIHSIAGDLINKVRDKQAPRAIIIHTYRFGPHSKGDDTRSTEYIDWMYKERDPLKIHSSRIDSIVRNAVEVDVEAEVNYAFQQALIDPHPENIGNSR